MPEEFTIPQSAAYPNVSEETVRQNIQTKRLVALERGYQKFNPYDVLVISADSYNTKIG